MLSLVFSKNLSLDPKLTSSLKPIGGLGFSVIRSFDILTDLSVGFFFAGTDDLKEGNLIIDFYFYENNINLNINIIYFKYMYLYLFFLKIFFFGLVHNMYG